MCAWIKARRWIAILVLLSLCLIGCGKDTAKEKTGQNTEENTASNKDGRKYYFKVDGKYFSMLQGSAFKPVYIKGVNLGSGKPGCFPGELAITRMEYLSWFQQISEMNCNTIRVYTIMMPEFYQALYEYNESAKNKLYLFQGVWYDETQIEETADAYDIYDVALQEARQLVDIFHGKCTIEQQAGKAYGIYRYDVSQYVIGWILGIESDAIFVGNTDAVHEEETNYQGKYLKTTEDATPYETFMCKLGDQTLSYEMEKYGMQRPVSWSNWPTADMLTHENEPDAEKEDAIVINVEHIQAGDEFEAGVFASYHIYPYYPEFMIYEGQDYIDEEGNQNPYRAYLERLIAEHTMPVLVAEYGIPTSRGVTHTNSVTGYDQGGVNEERQGEMLVSMSKDIYESGYCGCLIFTWQDEWFKRTWNTMDYTDSDRRAFWSDMQTSEQNYGLLTFDSGREQTIVTLDGSKEDWLQKDVVAQSADYTLSVQHDARYLYLLINGNKLDPEKDRIIVPFDITPKSGSLSYETCQFSKEADFVLDLQGKENSVLKVHGYYDRYPVSYTAEMDTVFDRSGYGGIHDSDFHPIYLCLNRQLFFPVTKEWFDYRRIETGILKYGNGNPDSKSYDSLADFCYGEHCIEVRIPWGMLNFRDPSTKEIEDDLHGENPFTGLNIQQIYVGVGAYKEAIDMKVYTWNDWDYSDYHERLKQSYYTVQEHFKDLEVPQSE